MLKALIFAANLRETYLCLNKDTSGCRSLLTLIVARHPVPNHGALGQHAATKMGT
jgi:hypothetical protein